METSCWLGPWLDLVFMFEIHGDGVCDQAILVSLQLYTNSPFLDTKLLVSLQFRISIWDPR